MFLPSRAIGSAVVLRSIILWAGIRGASLGLGSPPTVGLHSVLVLALVSVLSGHDRKILSERILLANLGVSDAVLRMFTLSPAVLAEFALHLAFMR